MKRHLLSYSVTAIAALTALGMFPLRGAAQATPAARAATANKNAASAPTPHTSDEHPDLSGIWRAGAGGTPVAPGNPKRDANGNVNVVLPARDGKGANFEIDNEIRRRSDPNKPVYKAELLAKVKDLDDNEASEDPTFFCRPPGVPRIGAPSQIIQTPGQVVFLYQNGNTFRVIPTDGRSHPKFLDETYMGDSVGHWEGDTLVVDVTGFTDDSWLEIAGYFHSTSLHVVERLNRQGNTMTYQATVEDPEVLAKPWVRNLVTMRLSDQPLVEDPPCEEQDSGHLVTKEHH